MTTLKSLKAAAYVRVSTDEQVDHGISLPSQIQRIREYCDTNNFDLIQVYEEQGVSGKDIARPRFNQMMAAATSNARPFDIIVVHSLSRFARFLEVQVPAISKLQNAGVRLISVTEPFQEGASGDLLRSIVGAFNQHTSDQCAVNTIRSMNANAAEGFWNGGPIPFGYRSVTVEKRGDKHKKMLAVVESEAEIIRLIFRLARFGDGSGPMGVRAIAAWLNERGYTQGGRPFNHSNTDGILKRSHYIGYYHAGKTDELKIAIPEDRWIKVPCPAIVEEEEFLEVAALQAVRSPKKTPPRVTNGVTLLPARIAKCGQSGCSSGLTVRTGKGGDYHYYTCGAKVSRGKTSCDLKAIRREVLDNIVLDQLISRIFKRDRLKDLLSHLLDKSADVLDRRRKDLAIAKAELTKVSGAIERLLSLIEEDLMQPRDPIFLQRMARNQARKTALQADIKSYERQIADSKTQVTEAMIDKFADKMAQQLRRGNPKFRSAYVRLFIDRVELTSEEVRIFGSKAALEKALNSIDDLAKGEVPIFDREWCRLRDSNT